MQRIAKEALLPGMKLAKPIMGQNGMVMLVEGTELTEKWIDRIQDMDVTGVFVEGASEPAVPLDEELAGLEKRFATVHQEPYMGLIKKMVRGHIEGLYS
jgi:hypothetical protein